ncbi:MAG: hypothetical protein IJB59_10865 [Oscillospiraceae bacterium]|nr:hypothetical protein [Oscillospiraceae bacterium]
MGYGIYRNNEGYYDPTAGAAMSSVLRKERSDRRKANRKKNREIRKQTAEKLKRQSATGKETNNDR